MSLQEVYSRGVSMYGRECAEFTDKGLGHSYINTYQSIFNKFPGKTIKMLDIGVHAGGSLWLWSNYLESYQLWGMDISAQYIPHRPFQQELKDNTNIITRWNRDSTQVSSFEDIPADFDIIIDDGDHHPDAQFKTFLAAWPKLSDTGIFVIEDIVGEDNVNYLIEKIKEVYSDLKFEVYLGNAPNSGDDNILMITK